MSILPSYRKLNSGELGIVQAVFKSTVDYNKVFIGNKFMPGQNVPVTLMTTENIQIGGIPIPIGFKFLIMWGESVYKTGATTTAYLKRTLVHELTHVWQGQNGIPFGYMVGSAVAQGKAVVQHGDRNQAYQYDSSNYQSWRSYNPEQQANIIEDWYDPSKGNQSTSDKRYVYMQKAILAKNVWSNDKPK